MAHRGYFPTISPKDIKRDVTRAEPTFTPAPCTTLEPLEGVFDWAIVDGRETRGSQDEELSEVRKKEHQMPSL